MKLILILLQDYIYLIPFIVMSMSPQQHGYTTWAGDTNNERPIIQHHEGLQQAADFKAKLMYDTNQFDHCVDYNGESYCPNKMAKEFGCNHVYEDGTNNIESIAKGSYNLPSIYKALDNSEAHKPHIRGIGFFAEQDDLAVGNYKDVWVFLSSNC